VCVRECVCVCLCVCGHVSAAGNFKAAKRPAAQETISLRKPHVQSGRTHTHTHTHTYTQTHTHTHTHTHTDPGVQPSHERGEVVEKSIAQAAPQHAFDVRSFVCIDHWGLQCQPGALVAATSAVAAKSGVAQRRTPTRKSLQSKLHNMKIE
jgi:hypothetical protein